MRIIDAKMNGGLIYIHPEDVLSNCVLLDVVIRIRSDYDGPIRFLEIFRQCNLQGCHFIDREGVERELTAEFLNELSGPE